jgi:hypothetical protein
MSACQASGVLRELPKALAAVAEPDDGFHEFISKPV